MVAHLIILVVPNPENKKEMEEYISRARPMLIKAGGNIILKNKVTKIINGNSVRQEIIVIEYSSALIIEDVFNSEEYKKLIPLRDKGFSDIDIFITES